MAYSTPEMGRKALVPSSDGSQPQTPTNTAADLGDDQWLDAIAEADSEIDAMIGRFYKTPVDPGVGDIAPQPINFWSRNIAAYKATLSYRKTQDLSDRDPVTLRYQATMDALRMVNQGTAKIEIPLNVGDSRAEGASPAYNPYIGDLWSPEDFHLSPGDDGWSVPIPFWWGGH